MRYFFPILCFLALFFLNLGPTSASAEIFVADDIPWSGYWWPFSAGSLVTGSTYRGHPAPLEKYDYYVSGDLSGPATKYGKKNYHDKDALSWEGMCFYWAAASILEKEPVHIGQYKDIVFHVGDKKGILTALYDGALYNRFVIESPVDFHRILENFIADQRIPIIMDLNFGGEIWNFPIFKYEINYTQEQHIRHYTTQIYYANDNVSPDYVGTFVSSRAYQYYFRLDAEGNIIEADWEGTSVNNHPRNASEPFGTNPRNPGLDYDKVQEIMAITDDVYEENDSPANAPELISGRYILTALDKDYFRVFMEKGDCLALETQTEKSDPESKALKIRIYSPEHLLIRELEEDISERITASDRGYHLLEFVPAESDKEFSYNLFLEQRLAYRSLLPYHPAGSWNTGIRLMKTPFEDGGRAIISLSDDQGRSIYAYQEMMTGLSLTADFERESAIGDGYIRVDSDMPAIGMGISLYGDKLMMGANLVPEKGNAHVFFPHIARTGGWKTELGLINLGTESESVLRYAYDHQGNIVDSDQVELAPGQWLQNEARYLGILGAQGRTISAETQSGRETLMGFCVFLDPSRGAVGRALVPATDGETELLVPHVASLPPGPDSNGWWTGIALMNRGTGIADLRFRAYDAFGTLLAEFKQWLAPKQNYVRLASDMFDLPQERIASVRIQSLNGQPISGFFLYGGSFGGKLAGIPLYPPQSSLLYLPQPVSEEGWWTGIGLINAGASPSNVALRLMDADQRVLAEVNELLASNAKFCTTLETLFSPEALASARYLSAESQQGEDLSAIYVIGADDGLRLTGDSFQTEF